MEQIGEALELLARVEALLRSSRTLRGTWEADGLAVDFRSATVTRDGVPVDLSALELRLLRYFVEHPGIVIGRQELLDKVWGYAAKAVTRTVDVHVAQLRQKIERTPSRPELLVTVHGLGYKFVG